FGNFQYDATKGANKKFGFGIGRAYLGYQYQFNDNFIGQVIVEADKPTTIDKIEVKDSLDNLLYVIYQERIGSNYTMQLKIASLQWKPNDKIKIQIGCIELNNYNTQDKFWSYKYISETFQDKYFKLPSADLGIISYFSINDYIDLDLALTNGEGNRFDQDLFGDLQVASGIDIKPIESLHIRFYYDYSKSKDSLRPAERQLFSIFTGYQYDNRFKIAAEYNYRKNNIFINNNDLYGFSIYSIYNFYNKFSFIARFDKLYVKNIYIDNESWYSHYPGNGYVIGFNYNPAQKINFSINYQLWQPKDKNIFLQHNIFFNFEFKI
ncbi:MAG: hypothetical protein PHT45_07535, partial [Bacteroidales bacterium]|nr:hypothetical protein [Bacteroidales bacterium]